MSLSPRVTASKQKMQNIVMATAKSLLKTLNKRFRPSKSPKSLLKTLNKRFRPSPETNFRLF